MRPDRLVFGVTNQRADLRLRAVYASVIEAGCPVISTDLATAELVKVAANSFLATKISFINAMAEVCEVTARGADLVLQLTEWAEFQRVQPSTLDGINRAKRILDGRGALDPVVWREAGWTYRALGRS